MNLLSWNVRGLGRGEKCITIKELIRKNNISLLGLVETKHKNSFIRRIRRMWGRDDYDWCESLASNTNSGGLIAIWDNTCFSVAQKYMGDRWIILEGLIVKNNFSCCVGIIYGSNEIAGRNIMYENLKNLLQSINKPIVLMGDFNEVLHSWERNGDPQNTSSMRYFRDWTQEMQLIDIPLQGLRFTWARGNSHSKLDRSLCTDEWLLNFPDIHLQGLKKCFSDHNPILLSLENSENWGPKPFRSYDCWLSNPEFKEVVAREWNGLPDLSVYNKMKAIKIPLKGWSKEKFGNMDNTILKLENAIHELHVIGERR